jgi:hypothetical protein
MKGLIFRFSLIKRKNLCQEEILPFYRLASVMKVSSLHDTMNLFANRVSPERLDLEDRHLDLSGVNRSYTINYIKPEDLVYVPFMTLESFDGEKYLGRKIYVAICGSLTLTYLIIS